MWRMLLEKAQLWVPGAIGPEVLTFSNPTDCYVSAGDCPAIRQSRKVPGRRQPAEFLPRIPLAFDFFTTDLIKGRDGNLHFFVNVYANADTFVYVSQKGDKWFSEVVANTAVGLAPTRKNGNDFDVVAVDSNRVPNYFGTTEFGPVTINHFFRTQHGWESELLVLSNDGIRNGDLAVDADDQGALHMTYVAWSRVSRNPTVLRETIYDKTLKARVWSAEVVCEETFLPDEPPTGSASVLPRRVVNGVVHVVHNCDVLSPRLKAGKLQYFRRELASLRPPK